MTICRKVFMNLRENSIEISYPACTACPPACSQHQSSPCWRKDQPGRKPRRKLVWPCRATRIISLCGLLSPNRCTLPTHVESHAKHTLAEKVVTKFRQSCSMSWTMSVMPIRSHLTKGWSHPGGDKAVLGMSISFKGTASSTLSGNWFL